MEAAIPREFRPRIERINEDFGHLPLHELRLYLEPRVEAREHLFERALAQSLLTSENAAITGAEQTLSRLQRGELSLLLVARDLDFPIHECDACRWSDRSADPVCPKCLSARRAATLRTVLPALIRKHNTELEIVSGDAAQALSKEAGMGGWIRPAKMAATA